MIDTSHRPRRSLKLKLVLFSWVLILIVTGSVTYYIRLGQKKTVLERQNATQEDLARALRQVARESILVDDETGFVNYINLIKESPLNAYAMMIDPQKKIQTHTDPHLIGQILEDTVTEQAMNYKAREKALVQRTQTTEGRAVLDYALPIIVGTNPGEFHGIIRIGFDQKRINEEISASLHEIDRQLLRAFLLAFFVGFIGALLLARVMTKPIQILIEGARKIGEGKLGHRIEVKSHDEIRDLADEFNLMAQKLGELDQMKQDFVSNVTHELRSPMTSIRGYIDLLLEEKEGGLNPLQKDYLSIIKNSAVRLGRFIDNLLDVAKIEAHKLKLVPETLNVHDLAHEMVVLFKPQAAEKKIDLKNQADSSLPKVFADKDKLAEVFINLTSNAIKFTPEYGEVVIKTQEGSNYIEISVEDSGVGIPSDMIGKLFNKFEQVKTTKGLARSQKGTGLGLMIAKGIVEAHGGRIWIESPASSGKGTAFKFTVPKLTAELEEKIQSQKSV